MKKSRWRYFAFKNKNEAARAMQKRLDDFPELRQEFEEHFSDINENTTEIQALFDYLREIESKLDMLAQRVDSIQLSQVPLVPKTLALTQIERQLFLALYTEESPLCFQEMATKSGLPASLVPDCISALVNKGVPFARTFYGDKLFLKLDPLFKELQAKENIVNLSLQSFL